jgi:hypothetical protein
MGVRTPFVSISTVVGRGAHTRSIVMRPSLPVALVGTPARDRLGRSGQGRLARPAAPSWSQVVNSDR